MNIIDPHLHLFDLTKGDYHWLKTDNPPFWPDKSIIQKNFSEHDLALAPPLALAGFVHIEAGFDNAKPWREIDWLETTVQQPFKSVAAVDLTLNTTEFKAQITKLLAFRSVVGVRHILDEHALAILQHQHTLNNLAQLAHAGLLFELQMPLANEKAVALLRALLTQYPELKVIINHCGSPVLTPDADAHNADYTHWNNWLKGLTALAQFPHVAIKCSGWEMLFAGTREYQVNQVKSVLLKVIDIFSIDRVMLASNFPLTLFTQSYITQSDSTQSYNELWQLYQTQLGLSEQTLNKLHYLNAKKLYGF